MGDRGVIGVRNDHDPEKVVYIYTHWGGTGLAHDLQAALAKRWRWDQRDYLTRIIYDTMASGEHGTETGFGIGTDYSLPEYPQLIIGTGENIEIWTYNQDRKIGDISFENFLALSDIDEWWREINSRPTYDAFLDLTVENGEPPDEETLYSKLYKR